MRSIEVREIRYKVGVRKAPRVAAELRELYGNRLKVSRRKDVVSVRGDLHNYKLRDMILWIMSGGKHGKKICSG